MAAYLNTPIFGVALTIIVFSICQYISKKLRMPILNPIALSIVIIIYILKYAKIDYTIYNLGGSLISFFWGQLLLP